MPEVEMPSRPENQLPRAPEYRFDNFKTAISSLLEELLEIRKTLDSGEITLAAATARRAEIVQRCLEFTVQEQDQLEAFYEGNLPRGHKGAIGAFYEVVNPHNIASFKENLGVEGLKREIFEAAVAAARVKKEESPEELVSGVKNTISEEAGEVLGNVATAG